MKKDLDFINDHFGPVTQLYKQSEESGEVKEATDEFIQALIIEDDPEEIERKRKHMVEEMADEWIMLKQNARNHCKPGELKAMIQMKIKRTKERIKNGYY